MNFGSSLFTLVRNVLKRVLLGTQSFTSFIGGVRFIDFGASGNSTFGISFDIFRSDGLKVTPLFDLFNFFSGLGGNNLVFELDFFILIGELFNSFEVKLSLIFLDFNSSFLYTNNFTH